MKKHPIFLFLAATICLTSCVKETLYNTNHPDHGKIIFLTTVWDDRGEDIPIPDSYLLKEGDYTTALSGITNEVNNYFPAGAHHINIWNTVNSITVSGTTATADYTTTPHSGEIGWFFTGSQDVTIEKDKDHAFAVTMHQQVRQLTLVLEATGSARDKITAIEATLSGIAGAINIDNGNPTGNPITVSPVFAKQADGKYYQGKRILIYF